jgi:hypothetical protein
MLQALSLVCFLIFKQCISFPNGCRPLSLSFILIVINLFYTWQACKQEVRHLAHELGGAKKIARHSSKPASR